MMCFGVGGGLGRWRKYCLLYVTRTVIDFRMVCEEDAIFEETQDIHRVIDRFWQSIDRFLPAQISIKRQSMEM